MATDIVRDVDPFAPSRKIGSPWTLRRKASPRRWAPDLGNGVYVREARTPAGMLCFRVCFADGMHANCDTLASAQEYAEHHSPKHTASGHFRERR